MRKLLVAGVAAVMALGALALSTPSLSTAQNQAKAAEPDSLAAPRLTAADSSNLKGPRQPIFFRHDIHAGQYKISCQYCHGSRLRDDASAVKLGGKSLKQFCDLPLREALNFIQEIGRAHV